MKKLCSILCIVAMMVSMLAVMVFPVAAAETATKAATSTVAGLENLFEFRSDLMGTVTNNPLGATCTFSSNDKFYSSEAINVTEGETYTFGPIRTSQGYALVGIGADNTVVASVPASVEGGMTSVQAYSDDINGNMVFATYTVPAGVSQIRVTAEALYARSFLMVKGTYTLQQWKDWVAYTYPAQEFKNLGVSTTYGRYDASSTTPKSTTEYYAPALVSVEQNDVIYYGPANLDQGYQLAFYPSGSSTGAAVSNGFASGAMGTLSYDPNTYTRYYTGGTLTGGNEGYNATYGTLKVVETFDNGQVIYAWRAQAAGQVGLVIPKAPGGDTAKDYSTMFLATKNQPFSEQSFYNYWDNQPGANLYNITLDLNAGHYNANGTWSTQGNHRSSHSIAVQPGEVIEMGPCYDNADSYLVVAFDANRQNGEIIKQTNAAFQSLGTTTATGTTDSGGGAGLMLRFTVPDNVYYINLILRNGQYGTYTAKRIGNLTDSDNLFDAESAIMGLWGTGAAPETYYNTEYYATEKIPVTAGETIFFGPARTGQGYQLVFENTAGTRTTVGGGSMEVYDTFPANNLTTTNSTGDLVIYKYTATADGNITFPVRSEYKDEFIITRGKSFSARQLNFYWDNKTGANLYNLALDPTGGAVNSSGAFTVSPATYSSTHVIDVVPGETIVFGPVDMGQGYHLCGWDMLGACTANQVKGDELVAELAGIYQGTNISGSDTIKGNFGLRTYTVPTNVSKLSIVVRKEVKDRFMVARDLDVDNMTATEIEDYYYNYVGIKKNSPLKGKTALFVGDSICDGDKDTKWMRDYVYPVKNSAGSNTNGASWSGRILRNYGLESAHNNGKSGWTLSITSRGSDVLINTRLKDAADNDYDYVVLHGGVNDAWESTPVGTYDPDNFDPNSFNMSTYAGGLEKTIYTAIDLYGDKAAIGYVMNFYAPNKAAGTVPNMSAYFEVAKEICAKWGIQYLDLYNNQEVRTAMQCATKASPYFPDDIHPNEMGYEVLAPYIGDFMETLIPYSETENNGWDGLADAIANQFDDLNAKFFTAASLEDTAAALEAAKALTGREKYMAVVAASELLVQSDNRIPVSYYNYDNWFYNKMFSKAGHFTVSNGEDLLTLKEIVADGALGAGAVIEQTKDIDLTGYNNLRIGSASTPFPATYNGNNHKLLNYTVTDAVGNVALFPVLSGSIKNLIMENANAEVGTWEALLVSQTKGTNVLIENVHIRKSTVTKATVDNSSSVLMSTVGSGNAILRNCTVSGTLLYISGYTGNIGFLAAKNNGGAMTFENCHAFGNTLRYTATAYTNLGGIIGESYSGTVTLNNCSAFNNTYLGTSEFAEIGGLVGKGSTTVLNNSGTNNNGKVAGTCASSANTALYTTAASVANNLYNGNTAVNVDAGETVFFGPVDPDQDVLGTFGGAQITKTDAVPVDAFMGGQVLYSYKAAAAGAFLATVGEEYKDMYLVTKAAEANQVISAQLYHNYFDSQPNANLYNVLLDLSPGYINAPGDYGTTTTHSNSHYIKVTPGETITFGPSISTQGFHGMTFDSNFNAIAQIKAANMTTSGTLTTVNNPAVNDALDSGMVFYNYTVPDGVSYITLINCSTVRSMFVALRSATGLTPASYYEYLGVDESNPLNGKSALFVGDSISRGARDPSTYGVLGWAGRIGIANNMDWANYSVSSTSLSTVRPQGRILDQLVRANTGKDYDYVVIQGGVNDAWGADGVEIPAPVGTVSSSFDPASFDKYTYAGGLEETLYTAVKLYGDTARIIYVLNYKAPNCTSGTVGDMAAYFAMGKQICEKWGVEVCDLYSQFTFDNYVYTDDLIHATYKGYDLLAPVVAESMKSAPLYAESEVDGMAEAAADLKASAAALDTAYFTSASVENFNNAVAAVTGTDAAAVAALEAAADQLVVKAETAVPMALLAGGNYYGESVADQVEETTVATGYEFKALADLINAGTMTNTVKVTQTADIDLAEYPNVRIGVGTTIPFAGIYDGGNKTIWNYTTTDSARYSGMFFSLSGTIKNLVVEDAEVMVNGQSGILVGQTMGTASLLENVHIRNSIVNQTGNNNGIGVLMGMPYDTNASQNNATVRNCTVSGCTINATGTAGTRSNVGFIFSRTRSANCLIENTYVYNNIFNCQYTYISLGGMVGEAENLTIKNSGAFGNTFNGNVSTVGGLVGQGKIGTTTIENSYTDMDTVLASATHNEGNATFVNTNNYVDQTAEAIESGSLAYTLKTTTATEETWVQTTYPMVDEEGSEVVKVTYVVDGDTVKTTYTDSTGAVIDPVADPEKADYFFKGWDEAVADNGDVTYTAHFVYTVAAANAEALITAIGEVDVNSGDKITAARNAYDALSDEEKELVENYAVLTAAEAAYEAIMDLKNAAAAVDALIDAIGTVTADSGDEIEAARTAYDALSDEEKAYVTKLDTLTAAEATYKNVLDEKAADAVEALITAIGEVNAHSGTKIAAARRAYKKLTDDQKALVSNLAVLEKAEVDYEALLESTRESMELILSSGSIANPNGSVAVQVTLNNNPGILSMTVNIGYDATLYTFTGITPGLGQAGAEAMWTAPDTENIDPTDYVVDDNGITWIAINVTTTEDEGLTGSEMMTVHFDVAEDLGDTVTSTIQAKVAPDGAVDRTGTNTVDVTCTNVNINTGALLMGDFDNNNDVNLRDVVEMLRYTVDKGDVRDKVERGIYNIDAFDADGDGDPTVLDVLMIMKMVNDRSNNQAAGK